MTLACREDIILKIIISDTRLMLEGSSSEDIDSTWSIQTASGTALLLHSTRKSLRWDFELGQRRAACLVQARELDLLQHRKRELHQNSYWNSLILQEPFVFIECFWGWYSMRTNERDQNPSMRVVRTILKNQNPRNILPFPSWEGFIHRMDEVILLKREQSYWIQSTFGFLLAQYRDLLISTLAKKIDDNETH